MKTPFFRTPFNYDTNEAGNESGLACKDKSLAQQQFKDESDINVLFNKYLETGEMPQIEATLTYQNFEGPFDFQTAMNAVRAAQEQFQQLPARIKNRFDNDPQKLLDFLDNQENRDEAEFLGLVSKPQAEQALTTPPLDPAAPTTTGGDTPANSIGKGT